MRREWMRIYREQRTNGRNMQNARLTYKDVCRKETVQELYCLKAWQISKDHARSREITNEPYTSYIDTDEIPGFFHLVKNHIFIARSEDTLIFYV